MTLQFKHVSDIQECERLWNNFSPHRDIYDEWNWRHTYYKYFVSPLNFIVGYDADREIGILPLQYDTQEEFWEFFGGPAMESNAVWVKSGYEYCVPDFFKAADGPVWLDYLIGDNDYVRSLHIDDYGYELDLQKWVGADDFIENKLTGKTRKHVRASWREFNLFNPQIIHGNWDDLDVLFALNETVFGKESSFLDKHEKQIYHDLIKLPYNWDIFSVVVEGRTVAVALVLIFKERYHFLAVGYDRTLKDLGVFINLQNIEVALRVGAKTVDFGYHDCGWKDRWNLQKKPYYQYWAGLVPDI
ncbi:MAG: GNAT family N-acetyltransferase [Candidatus Magasanikbacteria bacterium]